MLRRLPDLAQDQIRETRQGKKDESKVRQEMSIGGYALLRSALSARTRWSARRLMSR